MVCIFLRRIQYKVNKLKIEISKFSVVGAVNFVFTFVLFYILVELLRVNYLFSLVIVSLLGMFLTYTVNYVWVFRPEQELKFKGRLFRYVLCGLFSVALNALVLRYIVDEFGYDPFWVQFFLIPFVVVLNFSTAKYWSLRQKN